MSIFLIRYQESRPGASRGNISILFIRYALKTQGSRPGASRRIYEYIPVHERRLMDQIVMFSQHYQKSTKMNAAEALHVYLCTTPE